MRAQTDGSAPGRAACVLLWVFALATASVPAGEAHGQRRPGPPLERRPMLGPRAGYDFDRDAVTLGGQVRLPLAPRLRLVPNGDATFAAGRVDWQLNADFAVDLGRVQALYSGVGLAVVNRRFPRTPAPETKTGLSAFVGLQPDAARLPLRLFVEGRWTLVEDESPFLVVVGFDLPLGREGGSPRRP